MGARGPAPRATNMRILEGNPSRRPINHEEPEPESGAVCPEWLSADAKSEWARLAPILEACGILTKADEIALAAYCDALVNYRRATKEIAQLTSLLHENRKHVHPIVSAQRNYIEVLVKFGTKLGMSPSDRAAIKTNPTKATSKWANKITQPASNQAELF